MISLHEATPPAEPPLRPDDATAAARTLLEAYHLQDERERALLRGDAGRAEAVGRRAIDRMAIAYGAEFPEIERTRARAAGESFMRALFVQDEIENWDRLRRLPERRLQGALETDPGGAYGSDPVHDERWDRVRGLLAGTCRSAGIDGRYATEQTRFWVYHGQRDPRWERSAHGAHGIKLRAMVEEPSADATDRMGRRFVEGVRGHDDWGHADRTADLAAVIDPVVDYYTELFAMRSEGDR
ncbi:hypothetical protein [Halalkalicoccus tibetensis]|uniref:Uncharacterized protein n=1 Tax=Halalkalicoccus tibetensis TaxID=175632 RepID=A0ABD5UZL2_9EURY